MRKTKMGRFQYWLGSPTGALWYFGVCYALIGIGYLYLTS